MYAESALEGADQGLIAKPQAAPRTHVLIVEDDIGMQRTLNRLFNEIDPAITVDWATTAEEAFLAIQLFDSAFQASYSLVLCDIGLPGRANGIELWERCQDMLPETEFLFMSAMSPDRFYRQLPEYASTPPYLAKPFSLSECREMIEGMLGST